jgi:hypothetical protein
VRLVNRRTLLGHAAGSVRAGVARTLTIKLTKRGRALLRRAARTVVLELQTPSAIIKRRTRLRI